MSKDRVNLLKGTPKMSAWKIVERFGVYIAIGTILFFLYTGLLGGSGLLAELKADRMEGKAQTAAIIGELRSTRAELDSIKKDLVKSRSDLKAALQQMGAFSRKEYHPTMNRIKGQNAKEQIKETHRYNSMLSFD